VLSNVADVSQALDAWPRCRALGCTSDHIMSPRKSSWEHFGGRKDGQQGVKTLEADLCLWAHNKFTPVQAQAKLCHNNMYAATYRSTMEVRKEFMPGIVQNYNKSKQFTASGEPSKVSIFKGKLNPMHLSVQKGYLKDKVYGLGSTLFGLQTVLSPSA